MKTPPDISTECPYVQLAISGMEQSGRAVITTGVREHLDTCAECWDTYNAARWRISADSRDMQELRQFLGKKFQFGIDASKKLAEDWTKVPRDTVGAIEDFYRDTPWYVYNLTIWEASGRRPPYVNMALSALKSLGISKVMDFGAGVGTDSCKFEELGFDVVAVDFDNLASRFLRHRLAARDADRARFCYPDELTKDDCKDRLVWCMDVIEHLPDPESTLLSILQEASGIAFSVEHSGKSNGRQDFHFDHSEKYLRRVWDRANLVRSPLIPSESPVTLMVKQV